MAGSIRSDRWRDWVMLVLAVWLFLSPWILGFTGVQLIEGEAVAGLGAAAWNAWILGIVIGALAIWAITSFAEWHDWANGVLGIWLVVAPWILGFAAVSAAVWNHVIVGLVIVLAADWELWDVRQRASKATA